MIKFCSLYSGSSGNCLFISSDTTKILIDAGLSGKRTIEALYEIGEDPYGLSAILVSHEHSDHIRGAGIISRKFDIPIYANENTWNSMESSLGQVSIKNRVCFITGTGFEIGCFYVKPFATPHDACEPVGFNMFLGNKKITTATDIGHVTKTLAVNFEESDFLFLEANHDVEMLKIGRYPWELKKRILSDTGHLSNEMAGRVIAYLAKKGMRRFVLGHLSQENNFPELAFQTVSNLLKDKDICIKKDISLDIALRDKVGRVLEI